MRKVYSTGSLHSPFQALRLLATELDYLTGTESKTLREQGFTVQVEPDDAFNAHCWKAWIYTEMENI